MTEFHVSKPIPIFSPDAGKSKFIDRQCAKDFLASKTFHAYAGKHGVYVFALSHSGGYTPWYVGKTNGKKGMSQECMTETKRNRYNEAMQKAPGKPYLFFVVPPNTKNIAPKDVVKDMEKQLTQMALAKNPELLNVHNTKNLPGWSIKGVIRSGPGKPSKAASVFRKAMGI